MSSTTLARTLGGSAEKANLINIVASILRQAHILQLLPVSFTTEPSGIEQLFKRLDFVFYLAFGSTKSVNRLIVCVASLCGF